MELEYITKNGRRLYATECTVCSTTVYRRRAYIETGNTFTCSSKCKGTLHKTGTEVPCAQCGTVVYRQKHEIAKSENNFCSLACSSTYNNFGKYADGEHPNFTDGSSSYRARALRHYGYECMNPDCKLKAAGLMVTVSMLDVDHRNNDRSDNRLENLKVLCVWCHAEKTRSAT